MDDRNLAEEYADSLSATLDAIWDAIDADEEYEGQDAREHLDEMPLEIVWEKGEEFAVVLTTGGPHAEIVGGGRNGAYRLVVHWGGSTRTTISDGVRRTGEYFRELVEEI